jgi:ComF family protein
LEPPADDLVHALKYEGWGELADLMGQAVARLEPPEGAAGLGGTRVGGAAPGVRSHAVVVPVPTTARRRRRRGYNQAELLAKRVASARGLPLVEALARTSEGVSQTALTPAARRENVRGVFSPVRGAAAPVAAAHVLLVDDVLTTGATAGEAASALAGAGAASVTLLAFARALPTGPRRRP